MELKKVILVGLILANEDKEKELYSLKELKSLALTCNAEVIKTFVQTKKKINSAYYIGEGKLAEISEFCLSNKIELVIFDKELSSVQQRNISKFLKIGVIDRTELILEIFAMHAKTKQSKLQVNLAQLNYQLSHLKRMWTHLSRQAGGIGKAIRGPGETQIEVDRRILKNQITLIKKKLLKVEKQQNTQRKQRKKFPNIVLVGYTNAGKSTLLNALTEADVLVENKLFATLDSTSRYMILPQLTKVILTDTVGFINNLPHQLIEAFKTTLNEVKYADILLHIVDISDINYLENIKTVFEVLKEIGVNNIPIVTFLNKSDLVHDKIFLHKAKNTVSNAVLGSALNKSNINTLLEKLESIILKNYEENEITVSYSEYAKIKADSNKIKIIENKFSNDSVYLKIKKLK